ncbi:MAG: nucleotide sugar dehydrogenase [Alphaproteobacteria bacterium]
MDRDRIAVVGLGYVGLPLAVALARHFPVTGFDIDAQRVAELRRGHDRTREIDGPTLTASSLKVSDAATDIAGAGIYIVTVPTPVDTSNRPDLGAVLAATATVGRVLRPGAIVVLESTVYPGVTEEVCGPVLERESGLVSGRDFFLGYSPERINPGDREHTVERIVKVVAGQTPDITERLAAVYGKATSGGVFRAASIKAAEAAKAIENAQRDINIAFVNEVAMIADRLGLSIHDILEAAETKWNFLRFRPGLVGGHCIGVDPYYLAHVAMRVDHVPEVILAGRRINDGMGRFVARRVVEELGGRVPPGARALVLGLTFKEDVPDLRNSRVIDIVRALAEFGFAMDVHDPLADRDEAREHYGIELIDALPTVPRHLAVIGAVQHRAYAALDGAAIARLVVEGGIVADVKGMWRRTALPAGIRRWTL